jgi:hypothetical protein
MIFFLSFFLKWDALAGGILRFESKEDGEGRTYNDPYAIPGRVA